MMDRKYNVTLNRKISQIYDFIYSIDYIYNGDESYGKRLTSLSLPEDKRVIEARKQLWKNVDESTPGLALFFGRKGNQKNFIRNMFIQKVAEYESIEDLIKFISSIDSEDMMMLLIKHYDKKVHDEKFYNKLTGNNEELYSFINSMDNDALQKWEMTVMRNSPDEIMKPFIKFCRLIAGRIASIYKKNEALFSSLEKRLQYRIDNNPDYFIDTELKYFAEHISPYESGRIKISYSFFMEYFGMSLNPGPYRILILGFHFDRSLKLLDVPAEILEDEAFFKALGDKTRLHILKLLLQKKMYVGEIARQCNLRISTVSYHLEVMVIGGLLSRDSAKNHVFYMINNRRISERLRMLIDLFRD